MKKTPYVSPCAVMVAIEQTAVLCQSPDSDDFGRGGDAFDL